MMEAQTAPAIVYYIERVKRRLATGFYQTESVACFCGATDGTVIREVDRYGIPHRMIFCARCGVLYASPRMTESALQAFYRDDYRPIYDSGIPDEDWAMLTDRRQAGGRALKDLAEQHGCIPRVVFELGCNQGDTLQPFMEAGAACLGVDWDARAIGEGQAKGLPVHVGGLELLEQDGRKADLIILQHVLEHMRDLRDVLTRCHALLNPSGLLYVGVPTIFHDKLDVVFQNAHLYQFSARTLAYVMECCGFEDAFLSEDILSLWRPVQECRDVADVNGPEAYRIAQFLSGKRAVMPMIRTVNKYPREQRLQQLRDAASYGMPSANQLIGAHPDASAIVIAGGPSIEQEVSRIHALKAEGHLLFTIERMLPWCLRHGLMPDYVVAMDAHEDVVDAFLDIPAAPTYLLATQCCRQVFELLKAQTAYTFCTPQKDLQQAHLWDELQIDEWLLVNGGGSVATNAMTLAMIFGCRRLHVFGFDCQFTDQPYATGIAGVGAIDNIIEIEIDGHAPRVFVTTVPYLAFAQQCIKHIEHCRRQGCLDSVTIYGDSLVRYLAKPGPKLHVEQCEASCLLR